MSKVILFCALLFSSLCFANFDGAWSGNLSINGKACKPTTIEISHPANYITIYAAVDENGNHALECGPRSQKYYYMWLEETFIIKANELWRYGENMGEINSDVLFAKDKFCQNNTCEYFDYIKISKISENKISLWVDFDGAVLTGELSRK